MGKQFIRNSETDAMVVESMNAATIKEVREYTIRRDIQGSWVTVELWYQDRPTTASTEPDNKE
ncbi:MAG: hypothetical protein ABWY81_11045 [Jiangellaceae bacterium]